MKSIVITGSSSGIGLACVELFLEKGWNVFGISRNPNNNVSGYSADVRKPNEVARAFEVAKAVIGQPHVLINCAGIFKTGPFSEICPTDIDAILDTNVNGAIHCSREFLRVAAPDCRIINIGSVSGLHGIPGQTIYSASKHALRGFSDSLGQEGVNVTLINPGGVDTPLWNSKNPYPGDTSNLLHVVEVAKLAYYAACLSPGIVLKELTIFPRQEWH